MLKKVENKNKKKFDHSNDYYYSIKLSDKVELYFTAYELNKAYNRFKKHKKTIKE